MILGNRALTFPDQTQGGISLSDAPREEALPWWNPDGATPGGVGGTCVTAYQAKGAASYAASKVNIANPGTYDATEGGVAPAWNIVTGWTFDGATQWLDSTLIHNDAGQNWSMICQFDNATNNGHLMGENPANVFTHFQMAPNYTVNRRLFNNSGLLVSAPAFISGNMCVAGNIGYVNGIADAGNIGVNTQTNLPILIGRATFRIAADIIACAVYTVVLTAPQVLARATAMAAL